MNLHPISSFIDFKSVGLLSTTFLLDALTANPVLPYLTIIAVCSTIIYNSIKIITELSKSYHDWKTKHRPADRSNSDAVPGANGNEK